jgi:PilZ domain
MSPPNERRNQSRHVTCVPTGVESHEKERVALIRDASATGALLLTRSQFPLHEQLKLSIQIENGVKPIEVDAKVVRVERLKDGFWSWGIGVEFTPARTDLEPTFKTLSARQEKLYGKD